jgi:hypothetical protein
MKMPDVEIECVVKHETEMAYRIHDGVREVWIPKSQVSDYLEGPDGIESIFIPEWLATEKGLV